MSPEDRCDRPGVTHAIERAAEASPVRPVAQLRRDGGALGDLEASAVEARRSYKRMVARAYHDSSFVACIAPVAMLFIPCRGGVSHRPDEYASPEWISAGVDVLARTLARLSG